jgi:hypothetical protein
MTREAFVSGLAGPVRSAPDADPIGSALLEAIEAIARDDAEALEPLCVNRYLGTDESYPADPIAIEKRRGYLGIVRLVEWIRADATRHRSATAVLAGVSGRVIMGARR